MEKIVEALKVCKLLIDMAKVGSDYFIFGPNEEAALATLAEVSKGHWQAEDLRKWEAQAGLQPYDFNFVLPFIAVAANMTERRRRGGAHRNQNRK